MGLYLDNLLDIWGKPFNNNLTDLHIPLGRVSTDSRKLTRGDFFVPLIGERYDGHAFLDLVFAKQAQAAVISAKNTFPIPKGLIHWIVEDTLQFYQDLALLYRNSLTTPIVAVTGSVGKTTTRQLIHSALLPLGEILSTRENHNNDIGVPSTLLKAGSKHAAVVVEMGMRGLGEIERLSRCSRPDIAVITNIGTAHLSRLGSRQNIALAKCEITSFLNPNGVVIIPYGDNLLDTVLEETWGGKVVRVAIQCDSISSPIFNTSHQCIDGTKCIDHLGLVNRDTWNILYKDLNFKLPLQGTHNAINFMLALAVAHELNVPLNLLEKLKVSLPTGRSRTLSIGGITVMDETYNASPESVIAALDLLATKSGSLYAILGNMYELGPKSIDYHIRIIEHAVKVGLAGLVVCAQGPEALAMFQAGKSLDYIDLVSTPEEAFNSLINRLRSGDHLLLKASRAVCLERILPLLEDYY